MNTKRIVIVAILAVGLVGAIWGQEDEGLLISRIGEDTPAERAGLIRGDVLLAIDGNELDSVYDLHELLDEYRAGQRVSLLILRGGNERTVALTLEDRLNRPILGIDFAGGMGHMEFGHMRFGDMGTGMIRPFRSQMGVIVTEVIEDSPAESAGIEPRDAIISIDGENVSPDEFAESIAARSPGEKVVLEISRPGRRDSETLELTVALGENDDGGALLGIRFTFPGFGMHMEPDLKFRFGEIERDQRDRFAPRSRGRSGREGDRIDL